MAKPPRTPATATEITPLLATSSEAPLAQANEETLLIHPGISDTKAADNSTAASSTTAAEDEQDGDEEKPFPVGQVLLCCYCVLTTPIAFFSIFPFINKMIQETGDMPEADVGFYSGLIESLFSLTQMMLMISWGRASDRFGRKPVLIFSLFGVAIATSLFGLSKTVWQMILFRCLAGVFSGTVVTLRTMIQELSTPETQARAYSWMAFSNNLGIFIGPVIGGALSNPADQYPRVFGNVQFFVNYPYALPSFVAGLFGLSAAILCIFFIKETLVTKESGKLGDEPPMTTWEVIKAPGVAKVLLLYNYVALLALAYTAVLPVYWFTSVPLGGYNLSPIQISLLLGLAGLSQAAWTILIFTGAQKRWGTGGVLRFSSYIWPIAYAVVPIGNVLLKHGLDAAFWTVIPLNMVMGSGVSMAFTGCQLALNNISPSPAVLGTLNAVALALSCGIRAFAPATFASIYAASVRAQILDGYFIWVVFVIMAFGVMIIVKQLPEKALGKIVKRTEHEA